MKKFFFFIIFFTGASNFLLSESLWRDEGNLFGPKRLNVGDSVRIIFRNKQIVEFSSFQEEFESTSLNNPDKSGVMVLNFLPSLKGDNMNSASKKARTKNQNNLDFSIMCRVTSIETNGFLYIEGSHRITINNQLETVRITGYVDPKRISGDIVLSEDIIDLDLIYNRQSLKSPMFNASDFSNITNLTNPGLNEQKKREIILQYFNKIIPLLFR